MRIKSDKREFNTSDIQISYADTNDLSSIVRDINGNGQVIIQFKDYKEIKTFAKLLHKFMADHRYDYKFGGYNYERISL